MPRYPISILNKGMKAFLLAAGEGTRLRPLTCKIPKCLLPVHGLPLLEFWIKKSWLHGIKDVFLNTYHLAEKVEEFLKSKDWHEDLTIIREKKLSGTAGIIADNKEKLIRSEDFFVIYVDMLTNLSLYDLYEYHKSKKALGTIVIKKVEKPKDTGVVVVDRDSRVMDFQEKPKKPKTRWSNQGIYIFNRKIFSYFSKKRPLDFGYDVFPILSGKLVAFKTKEFTLDIGSKAKYKKAQREWNNIDLI